MIMTLPWYVIIFVAVGGFLYWRWSRKNRGNTPRMFGRSMLVSYTRDLTGEAAAGRLDPVIGRAEEIERTIHILSRRTKNNPLLLGEPGVGKTAIVEGIARRIAVDDVPDTLRGKRLLALDVGALISGTKYRGEFEQRLGQLIHEVESEQRHIILFIDEVQTIEQTKGAEGALSMSDIIKPPLARGDLQLIGATTWREYEAQIKSDDALNRRLQPVIVGEPSDEETFSILSGIKDVYEKYHGVRYRDGALRAAIMLSRQYITDRFLPDKAIDLIDEAGAKVAIEASANARHALGLLHAAGALRAAGAATPTASHTVVGVDDIREVVAEWIDKPITTITSDLTREGL